MRLKGKFKIRIFFWLAILIAVISLLDLAVVPFGTIEYSTDFSGFNYFIGKLTPADRTASRKNSIKIVGEPVYFSLRTPRNFSKAEFMIEYARSDKNAPIIEAGPLIDKDMSRYALEPIDNSIISGLMDTWNPVEEDGAILLQKNKKYSTIHDFLKNPPNREKMALFNYDLKNEFILPGYAPDQKTRSINIPIRGGYEMNIYIKDEPLDLVFYFKDINRDHGADQIGLNLHYFGNLIFSREIPGDKNAGDNGEVSSLDAVEIKIENLPEGAYSLEVKANSDIITEKIATKHSKLSFKNMLWIDDGQIRKNDSVEEIINNPIIYSNAKEVYISASSQAATGPIKTGSGTVQVGESYKQYILKNNPAASGIELKKGIVYSGSGVFAFDRKAIIDPNYKIVNALFDPAEDGVDYILSGFRPGLQPAGEGYSIASSSFDLMDAYRENGSYKFVISIPGLRADDGSDDWIKIKRIKIRLEGSTLWEKIKMSL
jgi:hypothetical protein